MASDLDLGDMYVLIEEEEGASVVEPDQGLHNFSQAVYECD